MRGLLLLLITNGARGQAAVWARGQRQLNRSHFAGAHATYAEQRARIQAAVGNYSFYVYEGGAFDAITTALPQQRRHYKIAEELVEVWVHRALLNDKRRTTDPEAASLFFVPAYLSLSKSSDAQGHDERLSALIEELRTSKWFLRHRGADHVFGYSSINPGVARQLLFPKLHAGLEQSYFGVFEMNPAWVGGDRKEETLQRMVPAPYVVDAARLAGTSTQLHNHEISVFFAAHRRPNAAQWSGCDRSKALGLESVPRSSIHIKSHRRRLLDEDAFAHSMRVADFCLVMCGDTPTSRRIFDAIVADCIPLIVGTRLWGRCEAPCHEGWGWFVSGDQHPHLPFRDTYIDYTRFPRVDERLLYEDATKAYEDAVRGVTEAEERDMWRYLNAIRDDVVYGYGSPFSSTKFGRAAANLMDGVMLRRLHQGLVPPSLRPEDHSPLEGYAKVSPST